MQEEVENRTVNLAISTTKLSARITLRLALWGIRKLQEREAKAEAKRNLPPKGKQTIRELVGQNQGVTNIDIAGTDLKGFEKYAREFGVDYAITRDKSVNPPKYLVFGLICTNFGEAWRMAEGVNASEKLLSFFQCLA